MGQDKHLKQVLKLFERSPIVRFSSIDRLVGGKSEYAKQLTRNLQKAGKVTRLAKGCYTTKGNPALAVLCFSPGYLGLQESLSAHDLWEQETIPVIITGRKVRQGIRAVNGMNVLVRRCNKKYIFGIELLEQEGIYLPYSDIEKTLIDFVHFRQKLDITAIKALSKKIDRKKLARYLGQYPKMTKRKALNILNL